MRIKHSLVVLLLFASIFIMPTGFSFGIAQDNANQTSEVFDNQTSDNEGSTSSQDNVTSDNQASDSSQDNVTSDNQANDSSQDNVTSDNQANDSSQDNVTGTDTESNTAAFSLTNQTDDNVASNQTLNLINPITGRSFLQEENNSLFVIDQWRGNSSHPVSDSQLLSVFGIIAKHIPSWFDKTADWVVKGEVTQHDFVNALHYLYSNGMIK